MLLQGRSSVVFLLTNCFMGLHLKEVFPACGVQMELWIRSGWFFYAGGWFDCPGLPSVVLALDQEMLIIKKEAAVSSAEQLKTCAEPGGGVRRNSSQCSDCSKGSSVVLTF